jgi:hypothetical protein
MSRRLIMFIAVEMIRKPWSAFRYAILFGTDSSYLSSSRLDPCCVPKGTPGLISNPQFYKHNVPMAHFVNVKIYSYDYDQSVNLII